MKYFIRPIAAFVAAIIVFFLYSTITEYRPEKKTIIYKSDGVAVLPDTLTFSIMTWNIGYCGLGANMDFFYDGGTKMRDSKDNTLNNLQKISRFLKLNDTLDFIFLQEVDFNSRRTYHIDEKAYIDTFLLDFKGLAGVNYMAGFVPAPLTNPMGKVNSGVVTYSKHDVLEANRYALPGSFSWPKSIFMLKRCFLETRYNIANGKQLVLVNTHNSVFVDSTFRSLEINFIEEYALNEYKKGNYVVVGGDWNQSPAEFMPGLNQAFDTNALCYLPKDYLSGWETSFSNSFPTNRSVISAYIDGKTLTYMIDFFITSPNIEVLSNEVIDLKFKYADHQPVLITFKLDK